MEAGGMARRSKYEYLRVMWQRYQGAERGERSALLDEVTRVCGYHRKYAMGLLGRSVPPRPPVRRVARRRPTYPEEVIQLVAQIWEASGYLCAQRLKAAFPHWLPWLRRRVRLTPTVEQQLQSISPRQIDRRLRERKQRITRRLYGTTRPGSLLKHMIPIKTDHWDVTKAGYLEIDLVSHSGTSAAGEFLHTLDCVPMPATSARPPSGNWGPLIATEKPRHGQRLPPCPRGRPPAGLTVRERMQRCLRTQRGRRLYARRKTIVEPVFGLIKRARGFRQFLLRGLAKVQAEWALMCLTQTLLTLYRRGRGCPA